MKGFTSITADTQYRLVVQYSTVLFNQRDKVGFFKLLCSLWVAGYWLSSAARVTSDYMEDNISVYFTFNLVI